MLVRTLDEKANAERTSGNEERETLHEYVGGWNSNPKSTKKMGQEEVTGTTPEGSRTDASDEGRSRSDSVSNVRSDSNTSRSQTGGTSSTSTSTTSSTKPDEC